MACFCDLLILFPQIFALISYKYLYDINAGTIKSSLNCTEINSGQLQFIMQGYLIHISLPQISCYCLSLLLEVYLLNKTLCPICQISLFCRGNRVFTFNMSASIGTSSTYFPFSMNKISYFTSDIYCFLGLNLNFFYHC